VEGRQPPLDLLGPHGQVTPKPMQLHRLAVGLASALLVLSGCTSSDETDPDAATPPAPATPAEAGPESAEREPADPAADVPPRPRVGACYDLDFASATLPTSDDRPVACTQRHTARTYYVGRLDTVVDGHLLAVDSAVAQRQVERACPRRLSAYLGGSAEARALSRLQAVWFSPTIAESDEGASWFRCDAVALASPGELASLPRKLKGILDRPGALDRVGLCANAAPGTRGFERVICARPHAWRALSTIDIPGGQLYPGVAAVREAGEATCRDRVRRASGSPERFTYGWEWPTKDQWRAGQHFGYCWAPDRG
jgi:hypothetical protein